MTTAFAGAALVRFTQRLFHQEDDICVRQRNRRRADLGQPPLLQHPQQPVGIGRRIAVPADQQLVHGAPQPDPFKRLQRFMVHLEQGKGNIKIGHEGRVLRRFRIAQLRCAHIVQSLQGRGRLAVHDRPGERRLSGRKRHKRIRAQVEQVFVGFAHVVFRIDENQRRGIKLLDVPDGHRRAHAQNVQRRSGQNGQQHVKKERLCQ